jgi:hypothetical protein
MCPVCAESNPKVERMFKEWDRLSDDERKCLIPLLLQSIAGWRAWSVTDSAKLDWLESRFDEAGIPFRSTRLSRRR